MQVLVVNGPGQPLPRGTIDVIEQSGWSLATAFGFGEAMESTRAGSVDAVIMPEPAPGGGDGADHSEFDSFLRLVSSRRIAAFLVSARTRRSDSAGPRALIDVVAPDISPLELRGRLAMVARYHRVVRHMESELRGMERVTRRLSEHFTEVDQEMQLAGRLQRDFLPDLREPIGNIDISAIYRPASFVSGDIFDVFRIDEDHTGLYLADAVGHGMAASLLTMFIKRSILPKRETGQRYAVAEPHEVLAGLNDALADEELPNCQFVTGCYLLIDHRARTLRYARGGHPYPILISRDGGFGELKSFGGLLGIAKGESFETCETRLRAGDKVIIYTDGVELGFGDSPAGVPDTGAFERLVGDLTAESGREMLRRIESTLDACPGSTMPSDDITILALEVLS